MNCARIVGYLPCKVYTVTNILSNYCQCISKDINQTLNEFESYAISKICLPLCNKYTNIYIWGQNISAFFISTMDE